MAAADEQNRIRIQRELEAEAARQKRMDELKAEREKKMAATVAARAASNPMMNPAVRPEAPAPDADNIYYYSWIGGATSGSWKLYKQAKTGTEAAVASATARSEGGATQATGSSAVGANSLSGAATTGNANTNTNVKVNQSLPPGFTAGAFPKELEKYFGASPDNIMGYKITQYTNAAGQQFYKLSISQKGAYGDALYGSSEFGAPITKDSSGNWILFGGDYSNTTASGDYKGSGTTSDPLTKNGIPFTGSYGGSQYSNGVIVTSDNNSNGANYSGSGTVADPKILNGKVFSGVLDGITYNNGVAQSTNKSLTTEDIETKARRTAQQDFKAALGELGLADLADEVDRMIKLDYTISQIKMELPKSESYKQRFPGMAALRAAGRTINEATYISNERGYLQTLRAYGLDTATLGSRSELGKYIANEVSPREFEERVNIAATRVRENPDVTAAFKSFYPEVDQSGVIAYLLNPTKGMDIIRKQIRISEIGAASQVAGFGRDIMGVDQAAALISAVGDTGYGALRTEFQRARQLATTQRRLAQIEGQSYSDLEAVSAVVGDEVPAGLASERRASREISRFGGRGGLTGGSLSRQAAI